MRVGFRHKNLEVLLYYTRDSFQHVFIYIYIHLYSSDILTPYTHTLHLEQKNDTRKRKNKHADNLY